MQILILESSLVLKEFGLEDISKGFKKITKADQKKVHNAALKKIGEIFEEDFANFLVKNNKLKMFGNAVNIAYQLQMAQKGNDNALNNIEYFVVNNLIDYYKSKLEKRIFKKSITGNKLIDEAYKNAFLSFMKSKSVSKVLKQQADEILRGKSDDILDIVLEDKKKKSVKKTVRDIRDVFSSKQNRLRYRIIDSIFDEIPGINKTLKRKIKKDIDNQPDHKIVEYYKKLNNSKDKLKTLSNIVAEPIMNHIKTIIFEKFFDDNDFNDFKTVLTLILNSEDFEKIFRKEMVGKIKISKM